MTSTMTGAERWRAALRMEPVDHLPFWPKLNRSYLDYREGRWAKCTIDELHAAIGSEPQVGVPNGLRLVRSETRAEVSRTDGRTSQVWHTPLGDMTSQMGFDASSGSWHPIEFPVKTAEDIARMTAWFADVEVEIDPQALERARAEVDSADGRGFHTTSAGTSPIMEWVQHLAGVENAHFFLRDYRDAVLELFDVMHRLNLRKAALVAATTPCEAIYFVENTSTTLLSPPQYREFCQRHINEYGEIITGAGKIFILHMCGFLKALLPDLAQVPANAFEAFTSPPVGDTTILDGRTHCPDKCLIGGTNAVTWTRTAEEICAEIAASLEAAPHHRGLILSSAGVMPPMCPPETLRQVCDFIHHYPVRC